MVIQELLNKKRRGLSLTDEEIAFFVKGVTDESIKDYEASALLMAIAINGMNDRETTTLTLEMMKSGDIVDLSSIPGIKADKHSTGGISDTTTIALVPILADLGVKMAKMSGRSLGFTGGTVDKLEAIPGFDTEISKEAFFNNVKKVGASIIAQTDGVAIADKKLYALRDVTDTIESIPLIASSIMSKKLASGADIIVLDVKYGEGAFMKNLKDATKLADTMLTIGKNAGRKMCAIISSMEQPLGAGIGCNLEIRDAVEVLNGKENRLAEVVKVICVEILRMAFGVTEKEAMTKIAQSIDSKSALAKLAEIVEAQGGDCKVLYNLDLMPKAKKKIEVMAGVEGRLVAINGEMLGNACRILGGGRVHKTDKIMHEVGIDMHVELNDEISPDTKIATIYYNGKNADETIRMVHEALTIKKSKPVKYKLISKIVR